MDEKYNINHFGWFEDSRKKGLQTRLIEGTEAFYARFQFRPNVVLVNPEEAEANPSIRAVEGVTVEPTAFIRPNNYWFALRTQ